MSLLQVEGFEVSCGMSRALSGVPVEAGEGGAAGPMAVARVIAGTAGEIPARPRVRQVCLGDPA